ncbi:hypothetical protein ACO0K2_11850 [Undibacterium sp. MH2W]|uniref:hypothetical protein n=1 Tax=Undibacterium sp. MH2W TaxID=3413044 RepID=UPI003BF3A630
MRIYHFDKSQDNKKMAHINDIRRLNTRRLASEAGGPANFARKVGFTDSRVSQLIGDKFSRNIGDKAAKMIEDAYGLTHGWLDIDHEKRKSAQEDKTGHILDENEVNLVYATNKEITLLTKYRESTAQGMKLIETAAATSEKDVTKIRSIKAG